MANPRQAHVNEVELLQVALLEPLPAHALPDQVHRGGAVEQNGAERAHGGAEGGGEAGGLSRRRVEALGLNGQDGQRDADVGHGTDVCGDGSARGHQRDIDELNGSADEDAGADVAHDEAYNEAGD